MGTYNKQSSLLAFTLPTTKLLVVGGGLSLLALGLFALATYLAEKLSSSNIVGGTAITTFEQKLHSLVVPYWVALGILCITIIVVYISLSDATKVCNKVKRRLFLHKYGNPLLLKEHEALPRLKCKEIQKGLFELTIQATSSDVDAISKLSSTISAGLNKKHKDYAITNASADVAFNEVVFTIEDVTRDKSLIVEDVNELRQSEPSRLIVQQDTFIDLTTSGSMLVAGKTRSGKTTSVISLLEQALLYGRDNYASEIVIIDPKKAELSRLPHTHTLTGNGEPTDILQAIKGFRDTMQKRQEVLNDLSEEDGDVVKWWDAGMHVSILFIDEYIACRTMFLKKSKETADCNIELFDSYLKQIVTMGASAGCYAIISIAEASVNDGGLPAMLRSACSTKILFKPTMPEARLIWDSEKLEEMNSTRTYNAGDAWFSSTDGINDNVTFVHFPVLKFPAYSELRRLLEDYYK